MKMILRLLFLSILCPLAFPISLEALETKIVVRALAHDAKFIGTGMGGVHAVLSNARTGEILDSGVIEGATGDTEILVRTPQDRETLLSEGGAAKWVGSIDIQAPTRVKLELSGPLAAGADRQEASVTFWALPGQNIEGDGIVVPFFGFVVHPLSPAPYQSFEEGDGISVEAHIVMMCGCPVGPDQLWDSRKYRIRAQVMKDGETVAEFPLEYTGVTSRFAGSFQPGETGTYQFILTAADPEKNNFGVGRTTAKVRGRQEQNGGSR